MANDDQNDPQVELDEAEVVTQGAESVDQAAVEPMSELELLSAQLESAQQELADTKEQALRTVADAQNMKRRAEKDVENARKFALEKFASELLVVADNMERSLEAASIDDEALKPILEGIELTHKTLLSALTKFNIECLDPAGEPFDPQLHQAMSMVENPDVEPNTVLHVMQKGYTLSGRLLRPAMVMVSKAVSTPR